MSITLRLNPLSGIASFDGLDATAVGAATPADITALQTRVTTLEGSSNNTSITDLQNRVTALETLLTKVTQTFTVTTQLQQPSGTLVATGSYNTFVADQKTHWGTQWWTDYVINVTLVGSDQNINFKNGRYLNNSIANGRLIMDYPDVDVIAKTANYQISVGAVGDDVKQLKRLLYETGDLPTLSTNATFITSTTTALNAFKTRQGLTANGICDGATWVKLSNNSLANWHV